MNKLELFKQFLVTERPKSLSLGPPINESSEVDFYTQQTRMQVEARMALAQAKDMAHMQMEVIIN